MAIPARAGTSLRVKCEVWLRVASQQMLDAREMVKTAREMQARTLEMRAPVRVHFCRSSDPKT